MSLFPVPDEILQKLDSISSFFWDGNNESHKLHLMKWEKVAIPRSLGGLGVKDLAT